MPYQVLDAVEQLSEQLPALGLGQLLLHDNEIEELAFWSQLKHKVNRVPLVERVLQAKDVGMAYAHENGDFLLETIRLGSIFHPGGSGEDLDCVPLAGGLLYAEEYLGKMAFAKLLEQGVLLGKGTCRPASRVPEDEASLVQDSNLILLLELSPLVSANDGFVNESPVAREVLEHGDRVLTLVLCEEQTMAI